MIYFHIHAHFFLCVCAFFIVISLFNISLHQSFAWIHTHNFNKFQNDIQRILCTCELKKKQHKLKMHVTKTLARTHTMTMEWREKKKYTVSIFNFGTRKIFAHCLTMSNIYFVFKNWRAQSMCAPFRSIIEIKSRVREYFCLKNRKNQIKIASNNIIYGTPGDENENEKPTIQLFTS